MKQMTEEDIEGARSRIVDEWTETICNGPGLEPGEDRELLDDAHVVAEELRRLQIENARFRELLEPSPTP